MTTFTQVSNQSRLNINHVSASTSSNTEHGNNQMIMPPSINYDNQTVMLLSTNDDNHYSDIEFNKMALLLKHIKINMYVCIKK